MWFYALVFLHDEFEKALEVGLAFQCKIVSRHLYLLFVHLSVYLKRVIERAEHVSLIQLLNSRM